MGADTVIIDYNAPMTWEQVLEVEDRANRYIWENHLFRAYYPTPEELAVLSYRSKKAIEGPVRITEFPGADRCACCGTHVAASGQVGLVKFLSCQKLREACGWSCCAAAGPWNTCPGAGTRAAGSARRCP